MFKIAINGFGRIGKLVTRRLFDLGLGENLVLINEQTGSIENLATLLEFDSIHGHWTNNIEPGENFIKIDHHEIKVSNSSSITALKRAISNLDLLIDCTGSNKNFNALQQYLDFGVKSVLVSSPIKDDRILNIVYGVNHDRYDPTQNYLVTAASCTTNCLAPIVKVLNEKVGIRHGTITTIHNVTNSQTIIDKPAGNIRRGRSALNSLFPSTTGSATAISLIFPELKGKLNGHAVRVPVLNASLTDCVFEIKRKITADEINELFEHASKHELAGILGYEKRELVSADYVNNPLSTIIDASSTMVVNDTQLKIYAWYDNEWGYTCRMVDIVNLIQKNA